MSSARAAAAEVAATERPQAMPAKASQNELSSRERRKTLADDVQAFLDSGKKIEQIPTGVSGQDNLGRSKHIVISRNRKR